MDVFISWSGERSRRIAEALHDWLKTVIQSVEPWMSKTDIHKGARWSGELAVILEQTKAGIICLTPDNLNNPWILFEAGALSKTLADTFVCPVLFDLEPSDIEGPLSMFQATSLDKNDLKILIRNINNVQDSGVLSIERLNEAFDLAWPKLARRLSEIPTVPLEERNTRSTNEIAKEILERIRADQRDAELRESEFYKTRDSLMLFMMRLFHLVLQGGTQIPLELAEAYESLRRNATSYLEKRDISGCPDCLGTGYMFIPGKGTRLCKHERLIEIISEKDNKDENVDS